MARLLPLLLLWVALLPRAADAAGSALATWRLENDTVRADRGGEERPYPVGSIQKPFVARAWARAHPDATPPRFLCEATSGCWRPSGHGRSGLARAVSVSCNAYFHALAAEVPPELLASTLAEEGFRVPSPLSTEAAIGLGGGEGAVIRPAELLRAYRRLTRTPWEVGEEVRQEVLAGLRDAALSGTASGIGRRGYWAKTGTVPALSGRALRTSGWVVAVEDSGWAILGLLEEGTGREAAEALAVPLARLRPWTRGVASLPPLLAPPRREDAPRARPDRRVVVSLFAPLRVQAVVARNAGVAPVTSSRGFVGPGATLRLRAGDRLGDGLWDLALPRRPFERRIRGSLACDAGSGGALRVRAEMTPAEYVEGVLRAELPDGDESRRVALGAAILRFLAPGPRHGPADVCDSTHCAWFVGRGPRLLWSTPHTPILLAGGARSRDEGSVDAEFWARILAAARQEGPRYWTSHCGGAPLSAHFVWGGGDRRTVPCPRHRPSSAPSWIRRFRDDDLRRAFGAPVRTLSLHDDGGTWSLHVVTTKDSFPLRYDEAHRRLARVLGWDGLPSPASRLARVAGGFEASGVGLGHRVGLCLGD